MQSYQKPRMLAFILLVFGFSLPFWLLEALRPTTLLPGLPLSALAAVVPLLAALILTAHAQGGAGVRQLLRQAWDVQRVLRWHWWPVIVLLNPLIALLAFVVLRMQGVALPVPDLFSPDTLLLLGLFVPGALVEEYGWTAYASGPLIKRLGSIRAGLLLGCVWAIIHFVPLLQIGRSFDWIAWWSLTTIGLRLLMTWFYVQAGPSLSAATLFHAMINLSWQRFPINGSYYDPQVFAMLTLGCVAVCYGIRHSQRMHDADSSMERGRRQGRPSKTRARQ